MSRAGRISMLVALVLATAPDRAHAIPPDLLGFGARTSALAMTGTSYADDYEAVFANPAGLSRATRKSLSIGLLAGSFEIELDGAHQPLDPARGTTIGFTLPLPFGGPLEDTLAIGAGFYTPLDEVLRTDVLFSDEPQFPVLARTQSVAVQVGLGASLRRWVPGLRVGVGAVGLATLVGRLEVRLTETNLFATQNESQVLASFRPTAGVSWERERFGVGFAYRAEARAEVDLSLTVENLPVEIPPIRMNGIVQYTPHAMALEGHYRFGDFLGVAHLTYRRFSTFPGLVSSTTEHSPSPPAPGFRDTVSPRAALEWSTSNARSRAAVRGGYAFEPTPAPRARTGPQRTSTGEPYTERGNVVEAPLRYLDANRHVLTCGAGLEHRFSSGAGVELELALELHRMVEREHAIPAPGRDDPMSTEGFLLVLGVTGGLSF